MRKFTGDQEIQDIRLGRNLNKRSGNYKNQGGRKKREPYPKSAMPLHGLVAGNCNVLRPSRERYQGKSAGYARMALDRQT